MNPPAIEKSPDPMVLPNLPEELIFEILLRLPVKSLLRFKCVSKSWSCLLSGSKFMKTHLKISSEDKKFNRHRVLLLPQKNPRTLYTCSLQAAAYGNSTVNQVALDFPFQPANGKVSYVDSINGLVCLHLECIDLLILWNPSIRKFWALPIDPSQFITYGFGYDESTNDYKIVGFTNRSFDNKVYEMEAKVYSLKTNSFYKTTNDYSGGIVSAHWKGKYFSGSLHWMARRYDNSRVTYHIASFDLAAGTFGIISMPNINSTNFSWSFMDLGGCLAVFYTDNFTHMDVYKIKDYAEKQWSKLISIPYTYEFCYKIPAVFMSENGGILLSCGSRLVLFKGREYFVQKCSGCCGDKPVTYVESLISPDFDL